MANLSIKKTDERMDRLRRLMEATGENTQAGALDVAVMDYLEDLRSKRDVAPELEDAIAERLSTPHLPIERQTNVGLEADQSV